MREKDKTMTMLTNLAAGMIGSALLCTPFAHAEDTVSTNNDGSFSFRLDVFDEPAGGSITHK